jgi:TetR/AcrR family transcriptional repressor of nem operon
MRYAESHRRQTHSRTVENASDGLRLKGAKWFSVVDLMKLAGLTHGGFYNHFDSRAALVGEAIAFAMDQMTERWKSWRTGRPTGNASRRDRRLS